MKTKAKALFLSIVLFATSAAFAQPTALTYFERSLGTGAETSMDLGSDELAAFADSVRESSPQLSALLASIDSASMRQFKLAPDMAGVAVASFEDATSGLLEEGWMSLLSIKEEDSRVRVFLDMHDETVHGVVALFADKTAAGYASVTGTVEMAQIMALAQNPESLPETLHALHGLVQESN